MCSLRKPNGYLCTYKVNVMGRGQRSIKSGIGSLETCIIYVYECVILCWIVKYITRKYLLRNVVVSTIPMAMCMCITRSRSCVEVKDQTYVLLKVLRHMYRYVTLTFTVRLYNALE